MNRFRLIFSIFFFYSFSAFSIDACHSFFKSNYPIYIWGDAQEIVQTITRAYEDPKISPADQVAIHWISKGVTVQKTMDVLQEALKETSSQAKLIDQLESQDGVSLGFAYNAILGSLKGLKENSENKNDLELEAILLRVVNKAIEGLEQVGHFERAPYLHTVNLKGIESLEQFERIKLTLKKYGLSPDHPIFKGTFGEVSKPTKETEARPEVRDQYFDVDKPRRLPPLD